MLRFRSIVKSDIKDCRQFFNYDGAMGLEYNLLHAYLWRCEYDLRLAVVENTLIRAYFKDDGSVWCYCMPTGENVKAAIEAVLEDAYERGVRAGFDYMSLAERTRLESLYPGKFDFVRVPETQDYIYYTKELVELSGKKFHAKRNHISKFYRVFEETRIETIDPSNKADVMKIMDLWCEENKIYIKEYGEYFAIKDAVDNFVELGLFGILIYVDGNPAAMSIGTEISDITFDVMFEKALRKYDGIYSVVNNEFAQMLTKYTYINREEDMGIEGLRRAKQSYNPVIIYDRFNAVLKND